MLSKSVTYAKALVDAWEKTPAHDQKKILDRFVAKLHEDHLESLAPEILAAVNREVEDRAIRRTTVVEVAHANAVTPKEFSAYGNVAMRENLSLVGGLLVKREGVISDASVAGGLQQIRHALAE